MKEFTALLLTLPTLWKVLMIILLPLGLGIVSFIRNKTFRDDIIALLKPSVKKDTIKHIKSHDLFTATTMYKYSIANINFKEEIKTDLFRIILEEHRIGVLRGALTLSKNMKDVEDESLVIYLQGILNEIQAMYEESIMEKIEEKYPEDAEELYKIVYTDGFAQYNVTNTLYVLNIVKSFDKSTLIASQKVHLFLTLVNTALYTSILDCETFFNKLNGTLKEYNKKYYGCKKK